MDFMIFEDFSFFFLKRQSHLIDNNFKQLMVTILKEIKRFRVNFFFILEKDERRNELIYKHHSVEVKSTSNVRLCHSEKLQKKSWRVDFF